MDLCVWTRFLFKDFRDVLYLVKRLLYPIPIVSCELMCINWNEPHTAAYITQAAFV